MKICECGHGEERHACVSAVLPKGVCFDCPCASYSEDWRPRMEALERVVETLAATLEKRPYSYIQVGASEPEKVREEQDDA